MRHSHQLLRFTSASQFKMFAFKEFMILFLIGDNDLTYGSSNWQWDSFSLTDFGFKMYIYTISLTYHFYRLSGWLTAVTLKLVVHEPSAAGPWRLYHSSSGVFQGPNMVASPSILWEGRGDCHSIKSASLKSTSLEGPKHIRL